MRTASRAPVRRRRLSARAWPSAADLCTERTPVPMVDRPYHHGSHARLLKQAAEPLSLPTATVDAIIVPTARPAAYLRSAIQLARDLRCPLVALCSKYAQAAEVVRRVDRHEVDVIAVDIGEVPAIPSFNTSAILARSRFERKTDPSLKRNVGLAIAKMAGWSRILFLDDDILVDCADDVRVSAALLGSYDAVGLENTGFPDNSVVCHAYRAVGAIQGTFIGGGALAVATDRVKSFFPNIYNEDWFFLLDDAKLSQVAVTGKVDQKAFDPYADPRRARSEEFGDCLAEGVYALLDDGRRVQDADETFWRLFLAHRHQLIASVLTKIPALDRTPAEIGRMTAALKAAQGRQALIAPEMYVGYLRAWAADRRRWQSYLKRLPSRSLIDALAHLGLTAAKAERH